MIENANDPTLQSYPMIGTTGRLSTSTSDFNLPYDQHGNLDLKKLRELQLRRYESAELHAELARREASDA